MKTILQPQKMSKPSGNYSHGVLVKPGTLLFIAGQTAIGPDGTIVGIGDPYAQAKQVFETLRQNCAIAAIDEPKKEKKSRSKKPVLSDEQLDADLEGLGL
mgnify:CR=1 FL=1